MDQPTEGELYEVKCNILAVKLSEAYNEITQLQWLVSHQANKIKELEDVSQENTSS